MQAHDKPVEDISHRWLFWLLVLLLAAATGWAVWDEAVTRRPWKALQREYRVIAAARGQAPPAEKMRQITNPALGVADRCTTCHLGISQKALDSQDVPLVFRTHPRHDEILGKHPVETFGCTPCHRGQPMQTKGVAGARFDHGRDDPSWEKPLATRAFVESSCPSCHADDGWIAAAPLYERGRQLFEDQRCFGCHEALNDTPSFAAAPPLDRLRAKLSRAFVVDWLRDPRALRADARMSNFWPAPTDAKGQPLFDSHPAMADWAATRAAEPLTIADFLAAIEPLALPELPPLDLGEARVAEGRALFASLACRGCHQLDQAQDKGLPREAAFAPALDRIGERVTARWLFAWLAAPERVWPETRMPDLRLSDAERERLSAFLVSLRAPGAGPASAAWEAVPPERVAVGKKALLKYGCTGCHTIPGLDGAGKPGSDLGDFGDKPPELLAWGLEPTPCDRPALECWTIAKMRHPRGMRDPRIPLVMPEHPMTDDDALALAVFALSNRVQPALRRKLSERAATLRDGEQVLVRWNCRGCHSIGVAKAAARGPVTAAAGGHVRSSFSDPALAPPPLLSAGLKFQPTWLFDFLRAPRAIRPWLVARMPTFRLEVAEVNALAAHLAALDAQPFPFDRLARTNLDPEAHAAAVELFDKLECTKCHERAKEGEEGRAPDLALAPTRLKSTWLELWLLEPQDMQPDTRMPTYFPLLDDDDPKAGRSSPNPKLLGGDIRRQIDALVALTMSGIPSPDTNARASAGTKE